MPVTTKNTGTRKPKPIASTFSRTGSALSGADPCSTSRVISPAAKAPSRVSRPRTWEMPSITASISTTSRTANWPLLCRVRAITRENHGGRGRIAHHTATAVSSPNAASTPSTPPPNARSGPWR